MTRSAIVSALIAAATTLACDPLVGGRCAPGYVERGDTCLLESPSSAGGATVAAGGGTAGHGGHGASEAGGGPGSGAGGASSSGAGGEGGYGMCPPPLTSCPGRGCVDLQTNVDHCGSCGNVCATHLCIDGVCQGASAGHVVVMGMSFASASGATRRILGNAVFAATHDPVRVLDYRVHAEPAHATVVDAALANHASAIGRTMTTTNAASIGDMQLGIDITTQDVVLIHDEPKAPNGWGASFGTQIAAALTTFTELGGIVVVLATAESSEMPDFLTDAELLNTLGFIDITDSTIVKYQPADVLSIGVPSPLLAKLHTSVVVTGESPSPTLSFVFTDGTMANNPVVIHRVID